MGFVKLIWIRELILDFLKFSLGFLAEWKRRERQEKKSLDFLLVLLNKGKCKYQKYFKTVDGSPSLELINSKT